MQERLVSRARFRLGFLEFLDDLEHAVAADHRIIKNKFECGRVFEHHSAADEALDTLAMLA